MHILPFGDIKFEAFQLLYVTHELDKNNETQELDKKKATSVTTIIVPQGANTSRILSYQIAYDSPDINCSPSYGLQKGANKEAVCIQCTLYSEPNANGYKQVVHIDGRCRKLNPRLVENLGSLYVEEGAFCDLFEDTHCEKYVYEVEPTGEDNLLGSGVGYISNAVRCGYFNDVYRIQGF
ncbi:uncharacterized protein BDW43DRAFT_310539 [Aspergillus alliaceus]|uniref:uncharacterized protein n=1 Tax=Petromyces alliaceus TaxID=209559 RepID=UPI0012A68BE8|nr:uncharacterized protein BDW43DRAFT_310539 [Aspergillus alliaceus]KAB8234183.1 hypothetical protein BDW43DRAFT_310539 [Aspergillus alliaceus]